MDFLQRIGRWLGEWHCPAQHSLAKERPGSQPLPAQPSPAHSIGNTDQASPIPPSPASQPRSEQCREALREPINIQNTTEPQKCRALAAKTRRPSPTCSGQPCLALPNPVQPEQVAGTGTARRSPAQTSLAKPDKAQQSPELCPTEFSPTEIRDFSNGAQQASQGT